jgi:DNA-binding transcriptional MerR regulator
MYTIGQFSRLCRVSTKALRHYEKLGLLVPARVEPGNRYRYYSSDQVAILKDIILMKELGLSLRMIKQMIDRREWPGEVAVMLEKHRNRLLRQVNLCNYRLQKLERRKNTFKIKPFSEVVRYETVIKIVPGTPRRRVQVLVPKKHTYSLAGHTL